MIKTLAAYSVVHPARQRIDKMETFTSAQTLALPNIALFSSDQANVRPIIYLLALFAVLVIFFTRSSNDTSGKIPSPKYGWPVVGNITTYSKNPVAYLRKATAQYGKVFKVDMLLTKTVWLRGTELNKLYLDTREVSCWRDLESYLE